MYGTRRIGNQFFITFNGAVLSGWSTYKQGEARQKARELDDARAKFFGGDE